MNIGDKVRLLHGKESGVIVGLKGAIVEIEIEDGFTIPVSKSEIVLISPEENKRFNKEETSKEDSKTNIIKEVKATKGLYWAFVALNDQKFTLYFINNTDWDIPFSISTEKQGILAGFLTSKTHIRVHEVSLSQLDNWGTYILQCLYYQKGYFELQEPFIKKLKFRANQFKSLQDVPLVQKKGYLFQIDKEEIPQNIDVAKIAEQMLEKAADKIEIKKIEKPAPEVDLHIETLLPNNTKQMNPDEILKYQVQVFEKALDNAIATGMDEIVFIHGVGNGTLKYEIQKKVSKHPNIEFYKDAQKNKFGYGATYLKLK
ncbi:MAG: Smr/MutS family protein [Raineya sp.]|jgi:dsDNA-specific endonuclease/ATPase MutS2|nr:Smr/MutS family protein [Raineya sp.]